METVIHNGLTYKMGAHNKPYYFDTLRKDWIRDVGVSGEFISRLLNIRKGVESLTSMPESTLGERAKLLRDLTGLTQMELAEKVGVKKDTIEKLEANMYKVLGGRAQSAYMKYFGITRSWLVSGVLK